MKRILVWHPLLRQRRSCKKIASAFMGRVIGMSPAKKMKKGRRVMMIQMMILLMRWIQMMIYDTTICKQ